MKPLNVIFAYRPKQKRMGGKLMRVDQLIAIAQAHLSETRYQFSQIMVPKAAQVDRFEEMRKTCDGAVVIFHKSSVTNLDAETRAQLKRVSTGICIDHLDFVVEPLEPGFVDVHLTASRAGEASMRAGLGNLDPGADTRVCHLRHHADPRLGAGGALSDFAPGYFGAAVHIEDAAAFPPNTIIPDYEPTQVDAFLQSLGTSNFHLCARDAGMRERFGIAPTKPFTKGFNAAAVGANVLVNRQVHDAEYYLGSDYPYMIDSHGAEDVRAGCQWAQEAYGTAEWQLGLERMAHMAAEVAPAKVAAELAEIVDQFR